LGTYQITNLPTSNSSVNGIMLIVRLPSIHFVSTAAALCVHLRNVSTDSFRGSSRGCALELPMIGRTCSSRSHEQNTEGNVRSMKHIAYVVLVPTLSPQLRAAIAHNIVASTRVIRSPHSYFALAHRIRILPPWLNAIVCCLCRFVFCLSSPHSYIASLAHRHRMLPRILFLLLLVSAPTLCALTARNVRG
jgi:hypothetical protein